VSTATVTTAAQVWGMAELAAHYPAWGARRIKRELRERVGVRFGRGQRVAVTRSHVEAIDAQLDREAFAGRQGVIACAIAPQVDQMAKWRQMVARALPAAFLLLLWGADACALDLAAAWTDSHHDNHAESGALSGAGARLLLEPIAPGQCRAYKVALATTATALSMYAWERINCDAGRGIVDWRDIAWGTAGGLTGAVATDLGITGLRAWLVPQRDGGAVALAWGF
jgi:hypothetical protein